MKFSELKTTASSPETEDIATLVKSEFIAQFPLSNFLEFYTFTGNADTPRKPGVDLNAGAKRAIGGAFSSPVENTPDFGAVALKIYGFPLKMDKAHQRRGVDLGSQFRIDCQTATKGFARYMAEAFINDTIDATSFSGLKEQCTNLSRKFNLSGGNNGQSFPIGNSDVNHTLQMKLFEALDQVLMDMGIDKVAILADSLLISRMKSVGMSFFTTDNVVNVYNQPMRILNYNGVPIINMGVDGAGNRVIPVTETEGTSTSTCTSLYVVKFGEQVDLTAATNVGLSIAPPKQVDNNYVMDVELDIDVVALTSKSIYRMSGIIL